TGAFANLLRPCDPPPMGVQENARLSTGYARRHKRGRCAKAVDSYPMCHALRSKLDQSGSFRRFAAVGGTRVAAAATSPHSQHTAAVCLAKGTWQPQSRRLGLHPEVWAT